MLIYEYVRVSDKNNYTINNVFMNIIVINYDKIIFSLISQSVSQAPIFLDS